MRKINLLMFAGAAVTAGLGMASAKAPQLIISESQADDYFFVERFGISLSQLSAFDLDTGTKTPLIQPAHGAYAEASPSGVLIWHQHSLDHAVMRTEIFVMDTASGQKAVIKNKYVHSLNPSLSPDQRLMAFRCHADFASAPQICLLNIESNTIEEITTVQTVHGEAVWSSDGKRLAYYEVNPDDQTLYDIYLYELGSKTSTKLPNLPAGITWPADWKGDELVLMHIAADPSAGGAADLLLYDVGNGTVSNLTNTPAMDEGSAKFSVDGKTVYFTAVDQTTTPSWEEFQAMTPEEKVKSSTVDLAVLDLATGEVAQVARGHNIAAVGWKNGAVPQDNSWLMSQMKAHHYMLDFDPDTAPSIVGKWKPEISGGSCGELPGYLATSLEEIEFAADGTMRAIYFQSPDNEQKCSTIAATHDFQHETGVYSFSNGFLHLGLKTAIWVPGTDFSAETSSAQAFCGYSAWTTGLSTISLDQLPQEVIDCQAGYVRAASISLKTVSPGVLEINGHRYIKAD